MKYTTKEFLIGVMWGVLVVVVFRLWLWFIVLDELKHYKLI